MNSSGSTLRVVAVPVERSTRVYRMPPAASAIPATRM